MIKALARLFIENRGPPYIGSRARMLPMSGGGLPSGVLEQMRAYGTVGVLNAIVSRISEAVAEADWDLYPIGGEKPVANHPAAILWNQPNPYMDQDEFLEMSMQHFELAGETDWNVARSNLLPDTMLGAELWPIRPDRLTHIPSATDFLKGWVYTVPDTREQIPYRVDEIIQLKRPNPLDPYRGLAPIAAAMIDVAGERAASTYNEMFFRNDASPGGVIEFAERMDDLQWEEFITRWNQQHQGPMNAGKVAMIEGGVWKDRKYTLRDMQFEELRKLNREFIRQAYGYPKSMLGDTEDVNKASAIAGEYVFVRWLVRPRLNRIQAILNTKLLPMYGNAGKGVEFRFTTPVPADKELEITELDSVANRAKILVEAGYDPEDVAKYVGLPAMAFTAPPDVPPGTTGGKTAPPPAARPRGRPKTADDASAWAVWEEAKRHWLERPNASVEAVAGLVGVSERTLRRYKEAFAIRF